MRFGDLRFGDEFQRAAFLGRPDNVTWTLASYCQLLYVSEGFQIDFDEEKFAYAAFFIGPDDYSPKHPALKFSKPTVLVGGRGAVSLSSETDRTSILSIFGEPESVDSEPEEEILYYTIQGITLEFELDIKRSLKRWNLYPQKS